MASDLVVESTETLEAKLEKLGPEPEAETAARQRVKEGGTPDEWIVLLSRRCHEKAGLAIVKKSRLWTFDEYCSALPLVTNLFAIDPADARWLHWKAVKEAQKNEEQKSLKYVWVPLYSTEVLPVDAGLV